MYNPYVDLSVRALTINVPVAYIVFDIVVCLGKQSFSSKGVFWNEEEI